MKKEAADSDTESSKHQNGCSKTSKSLNLEAGGGEGSVTRTQEKRKAGCDHAKGVQCALQS